MAEAISLPPGAFAAAKSGAPQPAPAPKADAGAPKAEPKAKPAEVIRRPAPSLREADAPKPKAEEAPADLTPAEKKIWKLKAAGEEFEFDATDEEAVKREIMKGRGADKRLQLASEKEKAAERAFQALRDKKTLKQILSDPSVGVDVKAFAEEIVWEHIQQEQREAEWKLHPEKKKQWEDEQELKARREADEAAKAENLTREQRAAQEHFETHYETTITRALDTGGLPKTPETVQRMADYLFQTVEKGYDLSAEDLVAQVRQDYLNEFATLLGAADGEQLLELIGEANAEKIRKADLKRLRSPTAHSFPSRATPKPAATGQKEQPREQRVAGSVWRENLAKEFLNRKK